jgi:hypothetical protein
MYPRYTNMPQRQKTMNYELYLMYLLQKFSDIQGIRDQGIKNGDRVLGIGDGDRGSNILGDRGDQVPPSQDTVNSINYLRPY